MFWHNEEYPSSFGRDIKLDGVICVVDALFGQKQMEEDHGISTSDGITIGESLRYVPAVLYFHHTHHAQSHRQIAGSDVILLNKSDLVSADQLARTEDLIKRVNPAAPIHRTIRGEIPLNQILDLSAYSKPPPGIVDSPEVVASGQSAGQPAGHVHTADCDHAKVESTHYEMRGISSLQVSCPILTQTNYAKLDEWLRNVLWENQLPEETEPLKDKEGHPVLQVLRCKGAFTLDTGVHCVLQGVRSMYEIAELDEENALGLPEVGKIVLIGKGLDDRVRGSLQRVFE